MFEFEEHTRRRQSVRSYGVWLSGKVSITRAKLSFEQGEGRLCNPWSCQETCQLKLLKCCSQLAVGPEPSNFTGSTLRLYTDENRAQRPPRRMFWDSRIGVDHFVKVELRREIRVCGRPFVMKAGTFSPLGQRNRSMASPIGTFCNASERWRYENQNAKWGNIIETHLAHIPNGKCRWYESSGLAVHILRRRRQNGLIGEAIDRVGDAL